MATGLTMIDASSASLILTLVPLTTAILGVFFLEERLTKLRSMGFILALTGVFFIQGGSFSSMQFSLGEWIIFAAMLAQANSCHQFHLREKATATLDSKQVITILYLAGSIGLLIVSLLDEPTGVSQMSSAPLFIYVLFFLSGVVATGADYMVFNAAIQQIGAGQTALFNNFVPFFGLLFAALFLNETVTAYQLIGFSFILAVVLFGTGYIEKQLKKKHSSIDHTKRNSASSQSEDIQPIHKQS